MAWYLDRGLTVLVTQLKQEHPGIVIGSIGDASHQIDNPTSDHNPEKDGSVDAIDPMIGPNYTAVDAQRDVDALIRSRDPRILNLIWHGRIISSEVRPWVWRIYGGEDGHYNHWHLSVNDKFESKPNLALWNTYEMEKARMATVPTAAQLESAATAGVLGYGNQDAERGVPGDGNVLNALNDMYRMLTQLTAEPSDNHPMVKAIRYANTLPLDRI